MITVIEREHGAATLAKDSDGWWVAECHDCPWRSDPAATDMAAEKAWYGHAGPVLSSREQLRMVSR